MPALSCPGRNNRAKRHCPKLQVTWEESPPRPWQSRQPPSTSWTRESRERHRLSPEEARPLPGRQTEGTTLRLHNSGPIWSPDLNSDQRFSISLILKNGRPLSQARDVAQIIECLPIMHGALCSKLGTAQTWYSDVHTIWVCGRRRGGIRSSRSSSVTAGSLRPAWGKQNPVWGKWSEVPSHQWCSCEAF